MIVVREILSNEWHNWKSIRTEALTNNPEVFSSSLEDEGAQSDKYFQKFLERRVIFGAWYDGELVGTAGFYAEKGVKTKHKGVMFGVYVKKKCRGKKIGQKLIQAVIEYATRTHVTQVNCSVVVQNAKALKLYEQHGFQKYATEPRALKVNGRYYDEHRLINVIKSGFS